MINKTLFGTVITIALVFQPVIITAFETDQYNLPLEPLADIGDEVADYTARNIREAVDKLNKRIRDIQNCPGQKTEDDCGLSRKKLEKLKYLRTEDAIAKAVYKEMGAGIIPFTKSSWWMEGHKFKDRNSRFKTDFTKSIYITAPFNYVTISSTVKLYGVEFGTDKIAHIFQQGYDYHKIYKRALKKGQTEKQAVRKAVKWGQKTEDTYFGTWVSGVYSNADLYANYAGLKFYLGLTKDVKIGNRIRPATLAIENGIWVVKEDGIRRDSLLKPFISNHLSEAFNPNKFFNLLGFRKVIRGVVRKRSCRQWKERFPNIKKTDLETITKSLERWNGENYGFSYSGKFITIANTCFDDSSSTRRPAKSA